MALKILLASASKGWPGLGDAEMNNSTASRDSTVIVCIVSVIHKPFTDLIRFFIITEYGNWSNLKSLV
jgi:hypothetical protein